MKNYTYYPLLLLLFVLGCTSKNEEEIGPLVKVSIASDLSKESYDGRLLLMFAKSNETEPRFQINDGLSTQLIFGKNVSDMNFNNKVAFKNKDLGYPISEISKIPLKHFT